jgi:hypothetical protein
MQNRGDNLIHGHDEISDLKQEIENFKREKERVRLIVGQIGGMPAFNTHLFNIVFVIFIGLCLAASLRTTGTLRLIAVELAIVAISTKLIYLIHNQNRVNHFQLWILSSIEWRLNEISESVNSIKKIVVKSPC